MTNDISPRRLWVLFLCMVGVSIVYAAVTWRMLGITNTVLASQASVVPQVIVVPTELEPIDENDNENALTIDLSNAEIYEATAYTAGPESTGKNPGHPAYGITYSGLPVKLGVVAVDPRVIPLGSIVWVEGYGLAVAADTGSAIKGKRIDVYFPDVRTAMQWGRKDVRVAVLR